LRPLSEEAYALTLDLAPPVISLALGLRKELVDRARAAGSRVVQQVHTAEQAERAVAAGADAIIAQGGEAGGFGGTISTLALVPQVVDAVTPVPVLAAGGVADGRGLAAAIVLGAQGVNIGTRFMAAAGAEIPDAYKQAIVAAGSEDAVRSSSLRRCSRRGRRTGSRPFRVRCARPSSTAATPIRRPLTPTASASAASLSTPCARAAPTSSCPSRAKPQG
jgi:NAD(P)H-dependent flavin oxidoreductase YrpB (nitropropane dioxygenase family)